MSGLVPSDLKDFGATLSCALSELNKYFFSVANASIPTKSPPAGMCTGVCSSFFLVVCWF